MQNSIIEGASTYHSFVKGPQINVYGVHMDIDKYKTIVLSQQNKNMCWDVVTAN